MAGQRTGLIRESELSVGQGYRNTYEQTKAEAEALVRSRLGSLPGVILRPSIIVGDSRTGVDLQFQDDVLAAEDLCAADCGGPCPAIPMQCWTSCPWTLWRQSVARLAFDEAALGSTVHLCAGPRGSATIEQVARRAAEYFNGREPRYVDPGIFFATIRPLLFLTLWGRKRRVLLDGRVYRDYFTMRMQFDTTNAERLLGPAGICPPPVMDYLDRLFHYCVASDWGRKDGFSTMNLIRRFQLARDRGVTVANLVDELLRRNGDSEVAVEEWTFSSCRPAFRSLRYRCFPPPFHRASPRRAGSHLSQQRSPLLPLVLGRHPRRRHRGTAQSTSLPC